MLKSVFSIFIVIFLALFFVFIQKLYCFNVILFFILFTLILFIEIFSYKYGYKVVFNNAFFANSSLFRKIFSGKITISFISIFLSLFYSLSLIFNSILFTKIDFIFIFLVLPTIFLVTKFTILTKFKREFKYIKVTSKKWIILVSSFLSCILYAILFFNDFDIKILETNYFEYLKSSKPILSFNCNVLNEFYTYDFYVNNSTLWLKNAFLQNYKFIAIFLLFINKFIFFIALNHITSFVFTKNEKSLKIGYFLKTIFILVYIVFVFIGASYINEEQLKIEEKKETQVEKVFKIIIQNGMKFDINASSLNALKLDINRTKTLNLNRSKKSIDLYIDDVYQRGAKALSKKVADFRYSVASDYMILWHSSVGKGANEYVSNKFSEFANGSFDKDFTINLENLIKIGIKKFEDDLYKDINKSITKSGVLVEFDVNTTKFFSKEYHYDRVKISGLGATGLGASLVAKTIVKSASKTIAKTSAKIATTSSAGGSGLVCGAGAVVCVPAFAVATWFGFDYAFTKGDEFINRDEYEKEIYFQIMQNKDEFKKALNLELEKTYSEIFSNFYKIEK